VALREQAYASGVTDDQLRTRTHIILALVCKEEEMSNLENGNPNGVSRREFMKQSAMVVGGASLLGVLGIVGCTPAAPMTSNQGIKVLRFISDETDQSSIEVYRNIITSYLEDRPGIDIELIIINEDMKITRATAAFQTGGDMGIFTTPVSPVLGWIAAGHMAQLDDVIQSIGEDEFLPGSRVRVNGHDWAMPYQMNVYALWYRKDLFEQAGLDPERPPANYEELLEAAKILTTRDTYGISLPAGDSADFMQTFLSPIYYQAGLDYYDKQGNLTFDKPEALDATRRYIELMKYSPPGLYSAGFGDVINAYVSGQTAMGIYAGRLGVALDTRAPGIAASTGVAGLPLGLKDAPLTNKAFAGYPSWYWVHSGTAHVEESKKFLEYLVTGWRGVEFAKTVPGHVLPQIKTVRSELLAADYEYRDQYGLWIDKMVELVEFSTNSSVYMGSVSNGEFAKEFNPCPWAGPAFGGNNPLGKMITGILFRDTPVEQAWQQAANELGKIAEDWKAQNPDWEPVAA
jgi:multiple sugar transport system substrate-binding protein